MTTKPLQIKLSPQEHHQLKLAALEQGITMTELAKQKLLGPPTPEISFAPAETAAVTETPPENILEPVLETSVLETPQPTADTPVVLQDAKELAELTFDTRPLAKCGHLELAAGKCGVKGCQNNLYS